MTQKENPLVGEGRPGFTGARHGKVGDVRQDTNMPSSIISLYNAPDTVFDVPFGSVKASLRQIVVGGGSAVRSTA